MRLYLVTTLSLIIAFTLSDGQIDNEKIYVGNPAEFEKAAEVVFLEVVRATPEYQEIEKDNLDQGVGKYWIKLDAASVRAQQALVAVSEEQGYDLLVEKGYLVDDITSQIISYLERTSDAK